MVATTPTNPGVNLVPRAGNTPYVHFHWRAAGDYQHGTYRISREHVATGSVSVQVGTAPIYGATSTFRSGSSNVEIERLVKTMYFNETQDFGTQSYVVPGQTYRYKVQQVIPGATPSISAFTTPVEIYIPYGPPSYPDPITASVSFNDAGIPSVTLNWNNNSTYDHYEIIRNAQVIASSVPALTNQSIPMNGYVDTTVVAGTVYFYSIKSYRESLSSAPSPNLRVFVPAYPGGEDPNSGVVQGVNRWTFRDVYKKGPAPYVYKWEINPNDGGSPTIQKNIAISSNTGPNRVSLVQEGQNDVAHIAFSGIILTQSHYETLEIWFRKRVLIKVVDDLGRIFYGVFSQWTPQRSRRASNPWYHAFTAEFTLTAYYNANGEGIYGRFFEGDVPL